MKVMSDADWQQCDNPMTMLTFLEMQKPTMQVTRMRTSSWGGIHPVQVTVNPSLQRKLRLMACACCRRIWHRLPEGAYRHAVVVAEQYADGKATEQELKSAQAMLNPNKLPFGETTREKIHRAITSATRTFPEENVGRLIYVALSTAWEIGELASVPLEVWHARTSQWRAYSDVRNSSVYREEQLLRANLIRDVVPSPFHKIEFDPAWRSWCDETITHLARATYDEYRLDNLFILADALEEAGCVEPSIINHCRQAGPHIRGCWVLDLILSQDR